jgi:hypothetical protein
MFTDRTDAKTFLLAGNSRTTIRSTKTGQRYTFKVRRPAQDKPHFVSVLTGSDNEQDYSFLGTIFDAQDYRISRKSIISEKAPSALAFDWFWAQLQKEGELPEGLEVYHEGRCGRCGRALTVPESIESGFGPECINHI